MNALEAENLHSFYGKSHILHGVSLEVREGEIVTLLGRNGAGKTTTLRSLGGLTPPRQGTVSVFGKATTGLPAFRAAAAGVGYVPEGRTGGGVAVEQAEIEGGKCAHGRKISATGDAAKRKMRAIH